MNAPASLPPAACVAPAPSPAAVPPVAAATLARRKAEIRRRIRGYLHLPAAYAVEVDPRTGLVLRCAPAGAGA